MHVLAATALLREDLDGPLGSYEVGGLTQI